MTRTPLVLAVLALAVPVAAAAQNRTDQQIFADLRMLSEQTAQLRLAIATLTEAVKEIKDLNRDATKALNARLDDQANATLKGFADQKLLINAVTDNGRVLREKLDDTNIRVSSVAHEIEVSRQTIAALQAQVAQVIAQQQALVAPVAGDPGTPGDPAAGSATPPATAPPAAAISSVSMDRMYTTAYSDYLAGQWVLAIDGFTGYLKSFPTSQDAYKAQYFIGEAYAAQGKYPQAIAAYGLVITNFKGSPKEPGAYFKQGVAYENLMPRDPSAKERARQCFQYVVANFPDSNEYELAKKALDRIK